MKCADDGNPLLNALLGFFKFLGDPIGTIMNMVADFVLAAAITVFGALAGSVPSFDNSGAAEDINGQSQWIVVYLAVGSLLFAAVRMSVERRGEAGITALKGIMRVVLVSGGATTVVMAAASLSERYSSYLFTAGAEKQLKAIGRCDDGGSMTAFLLIVLAFLLLIAGIIHTILLYIRLGVMTLLLGTLPLAAAASMTNWGGGWWRKHIGWMVAWLLYKPAAALVLYGGTAMLNAEPADGQPASASTRIAGIGVMLLSAVALPALLKLVMPATAALGGGGAMSGAMSAAGGALATGARSLGGALDSKGGGSAGGPGPSGASGAGGGSGSRGANGTDGGGGSSGGGGGAGKAGAGAGGGSGGGMRGGGGGGAGAASGALKAAGPVGMAVEAGITAAKVVTKAATGSIEGANGDAGHNQ